MSSYCRYKSLFDGVITYIGVPGKLRRFDKWVKKQQEIDSNQTEIEATRWNRSQNRIQIEAAEDDIDFVEIVCKLSVSSCFYLQKWKLSVFCFVQDVGALHRITARLYEFCMANHIKFHDAAICIGEQGKPIVEKLSRILSKSDIERFLELRYVRDDARDEKRYESIKKLYPMLCRFDAGIIKKKNIAMQ